MTVIEFVDFCKYFLNDDTSNKIIELQNYRDYFNAYNSFMVSRKMHLNDIKSRRMNSVIDYYMDLYHIDNELRQQYVKLYLENIHDNFNKILDPPANPFFLEEKRQKEEEELQRKEEENDDVRFHYKCLESKYKYFTDLVYRMNHPYEFDDDMMNEIDHKIDDNIDSDNTSNIEEYSEDDYYDEEIYDEYNDDYYSDEEY